MKLIDLLIESIVLIRIFLPSIERRHTEFVDERTNDTYRKLSPADS